MIQTYHDLKAGFTTDLGQAAAWDGDGAPSRGVGRAAR
jgi:hypothetical protein